MPFTLDESSLLIKGRKGDSASFTFEFNQDITEYTIDFYIQKSVNSEAIITKEFTNPTTTSITVNLSQTDTKKLTAQANSYSTYFWGLKIRKGSDFAQTLIPQEFKNPPMMYIYPEIGGI